MSTVRPYTVPDKEVSDAVNAFANAKPSSEGKLVIDQRMKCICGRSVKMTDLTIINTGVLHAINNVCKGCKKGELEDSKLARFVCARCRTVLSHVRPAKDKTGFELLAGHSYHVSGCDQCCPGQTEFKLLEKVLWNKKHHIR